MCTCKVLSFPKLLSHWSQLKICVWTQVKIWFCQACESSFWSFSTTVSSWRVANLFVWLLQEISCLLRLLLWQVLLQNLQAMGSAFTFSWTSLTWLFKEAKWPNLDPQSKHVFSLECFSLTWLFNFVFEMNFFSHCLHAKTSLLWFGRWEMSCLLV